MKKKFVPHTGPRRLKYRIVVEGISSDFERKLNKEYNKGYRLHDGGRLFRTGYSLEQTEWWAILERKS